MKYSLADVKAGFSWLAKQKGFAGWRMSAALDDEDGAAIGHALKFIGETEADGKSVVGYAYDGGRDGDGRLRLSAPTGPALWECGADVDNSTTQLRKILQDVLRGDYIIFGRRPDGSRFVQMLSPKNGLSLEELIIRAKLEL